MLGALLQAVSRKKTVDDENIEKSALARVLTVFDLTALGVGATLGAGVYVLTGAVAKETAGPSVVIAFLIAALTSILSGLCYAEFGARVPKAGSGYIYSYVTVGELCAFVIGWNLILSYVIGAASVARAWTANFDALINKSIEETMLNCCKMDLPGLAPYPDLFSLVIVLVLTALIAFGVREFAFVNKVFTVLNIIVILFVVIAGLTKADIRNWTLTPEDIQSILYGNISGGVIMEEANGILNSLELGGNTSVIEFFNSTISSTVLDSSNVTVLNDVLVGQTIVTPDVSQYGSGGFLPFGFAGLISGTATCFYAFVGFDCIATTGEEAINPQRSIPLGIVFSLAICCVAYLGISSTLTLMQPYFLLDTAAPLPYAFEYVGLGWARYPVSVGAICALSTSLLGAMFPMPRIIYAMATDGLLFKFLAKVHEKTKTPLLATVISGCFAGIMAVFFDLKELVDLMSIGTLAAYSLVAASVLLLRYQPDPEADNPVALEDDAKKLEANEFNNMSDSFEFHMLLKSSSSLPTSLTNRIVNYATVAVAVAMTLFSVVALVAVATGWTGILIFLSVLCAVVIVAGTVVIWCQPQSRKKLSFEVPFVPLVPLLNMFVNIYLMVSLPPPTWYKMLIWMFLGFLIYFFYGVAHSTEGRKPRMEMEKQSPSRVREHSSAGLLESPNGDGSTV